jgi:hypothetical protein
MSHTHFTYICRIHIFTYICRIHIFTYIFAYKCTERLPTLAHVSFQILAYLFRMVQTFAPIFVCRIYIYISMHMLHIHKCCTNECYYPEWVLDPVADGLHWCGARLRDTHTHTHTHTHTQRERQTQSERERERDRGREIERQREREGERGRWRPS